MTASPPAPPCPPLSLSSATRRRRIVVAVPIAPPETVQRLREEADEVIALQEPEPFNSVSQWYEDFSQTSDAEVRSIVDRHRPGHAHPGLKIYRRSPPARTCCTISASTPGP